MLVKQFGRPFITTRGADKCHYAFNYERSTLRNVYQYSISELFGRLYNFEFLRTLFDKINVIGYI